MSSFEIRPATPKDSHTISKVHVQSWQETYEDIVPTVYLANLSIQKRDLIWTKILSNSSKGLTLVATVDKEVVGVVNGGAAREDHGYDGELCALYLLKEFQKQGFGKKLFEQLTIALKQNHYSSMYLWVLRDNDTVNFYRAMGGIKGRHKEDDIGGKTLVEDMYFWPEL